MVTSRQPRRAAPDESTPQLPQAAPPGYGAGHAGHDFTLQAVMELQKSAGEANANITAIRSTLDGLNAKLDGFAHLSGQVAAMRSTLDEVKSKTDGHGEAGAHMVAMRSTLDGVKSKVDDLVGWKHKIIGGAAVLAAVSGLIGFVLAKAGDYVVWRSPTATAPAPSVAAPPAPPVK